MENLWEMIAKARGVELNEEFKWNDLTYKINGYDGLLVLDCSCVWVVSGRMHGFIKGEGTIEKIPFRPQEGDVYYTFCLNKEVTSSWWGDNSIDYARLIAGIVFRTREEAEAYIPIWQEIISKL